MSEENSGYLPGEVMTESMLPGWMRQSNMTKSDFIMRLKEYRRKTEMTQDQAAGTVPVPVRTWSRWEKGHNLPRSRTLISRLTMMRII